MSVYKPRTDLVRFPDWEQRLIVLVNEWRSTEYRYGETDCWQFMLAAVKTQTGETLLPEVIWPKKLIPVIRIMIVHGWNDIEDAMNDLLPPIEPQASRRGDIISFVHHGENHLAVRAGDTALTPTVQGLAAFESERWNCAWQVG